jgi:GATA-binding protein
MLTRVPIAQKLHGVVRPLSLKTDVIKKRCAISRELRLYRGGVADYAMALIFQEPSFRRSEFGCAQEQPWAPEARRVTRPRSSTTSNTPLALPGSRLSPGSRMGAGAAVAGSLALKRQRRTSTGGPGNLIRKLPTEGSGT